MLPENAATIRSGCFPKYMFLFTSAMEGQYTGFYSYGTATTIWYWTFDVNNLISVLTPK